MEDLTCAKCSKLSHKILALECEHSLCIPCATQAMQHYSRSPRSSKVDTKHLPEIQCQICGSISVLHKSAYSQLLPSDNARKPKPYSKSRMVEQSTAKEEIESMLFCLDCQKNCFTIDDYLNGMHSGHNVKNVKRSESILKELLGELGSKVKQVIEVSVNQSNKLVERKRDLVENFGSMKKTVKQQFERMRVALQEKQEELMNMVEEVMVGLFLQIDNSILEVKHHLQKYEGIHRQVEQKLCCPNKVVGFNYFSERRQDVLQEISYPLQAMSKHTLESVRCLYLNNSVLSEAFDNIKRIKLVFGETPLPSIQIKQALNDDFFELKKNQVFNQTTKKEFKDFRNKTLVTVKSAESLGIQQKGTKVGTSKGVNQRLRELQLLIASPANTLKQKLFY